MPKILVPVDFSPASLNAAIYASHFGKAIGASRVTLLSVVSESITGSDGTPVSGDTDERDRAILHQLEELQVSLYQMTGVPTSVELKAGYFADLTPQFMKQHIFDFIVMGVTGSEALEEVFGTSNAVEIIARSSTPVVIVPPHVAYNGIGNVALAVELLNMESVVPLGELDRWLHWLKSKVHIAHVLTEAKTEISTEEKDELDKFTERLAIFNPLVHILKGPGFTPALNKMAEENRVDLLITFPQRHSYLNLFFRSSHTKKLVFKSKVPVLALPHPMQQMEY